MTQRLEVDVAVVGASVGGCTAATLFARAGFSVALIEQSADPHSFKRVCTHYIQPCARGVISRLGIERTLREAGAVPNRLDVWTHWGWVRGAAGLPSGFNVRRQTLDPILRQMARATPGVELLAGHTLRALQAVGDQRSELLIESGSKEAASVRARLVVAADGRNSSVAEFASVPHVDRPNNRFTYFTYYRNLPLSNGGTAQYWHMGENLAYAFVNEENTTLLGAFLPLNKLSGFKQDLEKSFDDFWRAVPSGPDIDRAERICEHRGMLKLPNRSRPAAMRNIAFVGDAALSLDPIWGTGCGWAFQSSEWLVDATSEALRSGSESALKRALNRYRALHRSNTALHALHISDFSKVRPDRWLERLLFAAAARDASVARRLHTYLARLCGASSLLAPSSLARAAAVLLHAALSSTSSVGAQLPAAPRQE